MELARNRESDNGNSDIITLNKVFDDSARRTISRTISTKLMIPIPHMNHIPRELLMSKLEGILNKKLSLISAPTGYGKTTLISMWLRKKGTSIKTAWVSLDENDNTINKFWEYVLVALEKATSISRGSYTYIDPSIKEDSIVILLNGLINKLSNMPKHIVLVIDDYQIVREKSIHHSIQYFINWLPPNVHIVIISRNTPPIKLARFRGYGELLELKNEDLRFTLPEVSEFMNGVMKLRLSENKIRKLEEWTEGWIAALNLTALTLKKSADTNIYFNDITRLDDNLIEYLSEEVFNFLDPALKSFLLKTSILDSFTSELCNTVVGIDNSQEIICILEKDNIFISALGSKRKNYRYHSLFANFLKVRFIKSYSKIVDELYLKASHWYEENYMIQEALDYSLKSNNCMNTGRLIEKYGEIMIINRDLARVARIIEALPKQLIIENANICALYTSAVAGKNGSGKNGICIGDIFVSFEDNVLTESKEALLLIRITLAYANENFKTALEYGEKLHENTYEKNIFQCLLYKILIQIYSITGAPEKAESCLDLFIVAMKKKNCYDEFFIDISYTHIVVQILCGVGKYRRALEILTRFEQKFKSNDILLPATANSIYLDLGYLHYEYGELESSLSSIEKCIEISSVKMDFFRLISGYVLVARINQNTGNYADTMEYIKKADDLCSKYSARLMMINQIAFIVRTLLSVGEVEYVEYLIRKYRISVQNSYDVLYEEAYLALADLYIVKGKFLEAEEILDKLYKEVMGTERHLNYIRIMILKALLSKCRKNEAEAVKYMKDAIERASEQGYISTFTNFGTPVAEIICKVLNQKDEEGLKNEKDIDYASCILSHIKEPKILMFKGNLELMMLLSKREYEVLKYILNGLTNKEIASKLYVAECTVKKHINNIYAKIGVANRGQARQLCEKLNQ